MTVPAAESGCAEAVAALAKGYEKAEEGWDL
jgi:hypothetical protein